PLRSATGRGTRRTRSGTTTAARGPPGARAEPTGPPAAGSLEGVLGPRVRACGDLGAVLTGRLLELCAQIRVGLHELPVEAGEPGHVLPHQHLPVAVGAGTDADRRHLERCGHGGR